MFSVVQHLSKCRGVSVRGIKFVCRGYIERIRLEKIKPKRHVKDRHKQHHEGGRNNGHGYGPSLTRFERNNGTYKCNRNS